MKKLIESTKRLQGDIDRCISRLVNARQYHDKIEGAGAVLDMERLLVASAQQLQCYIDKLEECGSVVEWQTGEPTEEGKYIVTLLEGAVIVGELYPYEYVKDSRKTIEYAWRHSFQDSVIAWCKVSNIEPYKEEQP